jgi:hypothetical protein
MSMPSREEERHNYFVNELRSRFSEHEILKHFADLMRQRMRKGDEAMMDWALDYMVERIDISDALDEVADAIGFGEINV